MWMCPLHEIVRLTMLKPQSQIEGFDLTEGTLTFVYSASLGNFHHPSSRVIVEERQHQLSLRLHRLENKLTLRVIPHPIDLDLPQPVYATRRFTIMIEQEPAISILHDTTMGCPTIDWL